MIWGLAPMDGITNCAYRIVVKQIFERYNKNSNDELRLRTEFMSAEGYIRNPQRLVTHLIHCDYETPLIAQIYGGELKALVQTAQSIEHLYPHFAGIELNIGCPSPKVMSCGGGAGMMKDKKKTLEIIKAIKESISLPFSIKTRVGLNNDDLDDQFSFVCEAIPYCSTISIHGRTYKQSHAGEVDRDFIYKLKQKAGDQCRIIGNGGIKNHQQAREACYNLDGVMIGQSAIGNPRIFVDHTPSPQEIYELCIFHLKLALICEQRYIDHAHFDDYFVMPSYAYCMDQVNHFDSKKTAHLTRTIIEYRKYLFNYITGLPNNKELKKLLAQEHNYDRIIDHLDNFFGSIKN